MPRTDQSRTPDFATRPDVGEVRLKRGALGAPPDAGGGTPIRRFMVLVASIVGIGALHRICCGAGVQDPSLLRTGAARGYIIREAATGGVAAVIRIAYNRR